MRRRVTITLTKASVYSDPDHVTARHGPEQGRVQVPIHEAVVVGSVEPEDGEEDGRYDQGAAVDGDRGSPLLRLPDLLG
jgi:hypothetical protein